MDIEQLKKNMNLGNRRAEKEPVNKEDLIKARLGTYFQRYNKYSRKAKPQKKESSVFDDEQSSQTSKIMQGNQKFHPEYFKRQLEKADMAGFRFERYSRITDEIIKALQEPMKKVVHSLIDCKIMDEAPITQEVLDMSELDNSALDDLRKFNWSYEISSKCGRFSDMLTDLDCILINMRLEQMVKKPSTSPKINLFDMTLDIVEGTATFDNNINEVLILRRTEDNDRARCRRSGKTNNGQQFNLSAEQCALEFVKMDGEYGERWAEEEHGARFTLPSAQEIVDGIATFFDLEIKERTKNMPSSRAKGFQQQYRAVFDKILELAGFQDPDEPFYYALPTEGEGNLLSPTSKATCLSLWLCTIEPPFYAALNKASESMDLSYLKMLGPLARAVSVILSGAEEERPDRVDVGDDILWEQPEHPLGTFCSSFLLFRSVAMKPEWLTEWHHAVGKKGLKTMDQTTDTWVVKPGDEDRPGFIYLQGMTSAYVNFREALKLGRSLDPSMRQVLFVICMHNYGPFAGFRMNSNNYSAHYAENEVLLMEGAPMFVLGIEEIDVDHSKRHEFLSLSIMTDADRNFLENEQCYWRDFDGRKLTVVYLFNATDYEDAVDDVIQKTMANAAAVRAQPQPEDQE